MSYHVSRGKNMSSLSAIDTSQYTTAISSTFEAFEPKSPEEYQNEQTPNVAAVEEKETPKVDLSNYYSNVVPPELNANVKSQVTQASQNLNNAITAAVANGGMSAQDAINIQKAKTAYEATISAANTQSTFELQVG